MSVKDHAGDDGHQQTEFEVAVADLLDGDYGRDSRGCSLVQSEPRWQKGGKEPPDEQSYTDPKASALLAQSPLVIITKDALWRAAVTGLAGGALESAWEFPWREWWTRRRLRRLR